MLRALLRLAFVFWMVSILVFLLPLAMPGDPAAIALSERQQAASAENLQALRRDWGLGRHRTGAGEASRVWEGFVRLKLGPGAAGPRADGRSRCPAP